MKTIGVLGLQGGVAEHHQLLATLTNVRSIDVKYPYQLEELDGLIIPGGESTTLGRLLNTFDLVNPLRQKIEEGMPVWGTCAGMILLAKEIEGEEAAHLGVMDLSVRRNAFGRQLGSFKAQQKVEILGKEVPLVFIRAPLVSKVGKGVEVLVTVKDEIVACKQKNMLATSFHPELTNDNSFHAYFINHYI